MEEEKRDSATLEGQELEDTEDFVEIHSFGSELNAISFKAALNSVGIDVILRKMATSMFPAPFDTVRLAVRASDVEKAKEIIAEILEDQSKPIEAQGEEDEGAVEASQEEEP
ncbi:MAG: hypothetical protein Kow0090_15730 [Myxococcota bacterium]